MTKQQQQNGIFYFIPKTANIAIADSNVTFEELQEIICNLSFDTPNATVNYAIEVCPQTNIKSEKN